MKNNTNSKKDQNIFTPSQGNKDAQHETEANKENLDSEYSGLRLSSPVRHNQINEKDQSPWSQFCLSELSPIDGNKLGEASNSNNNSRKVYPSFEDSLHFPPNDAVIRGLDFSNIRNTLILAPIPKSPTFGSDKRDSHDSGNFENGDSANKDPDMQPRPKHSIFDINSAEKGKIPAIKKNLFSTKHSNDNSHSKSFNLMERSVPNPTEDPISIMNMPLSSHGINPNVPSQIHELNTNPFPLSSNKSGQNQGYNSFHLINARDISQPNHPFNNSQTVKRPNYRRDPEQYTTPRQKEYPNARKRSESYQDNQYAMYPNSTIPQEIQLQSRNLNGFVAPGNGSNDFHEGVIQQQQHQHQHQQSQSSYNPHSHYDNSGNSNERMNNRSGGGNHSNSHNQQSIQRIYQDDGNVPQVRHKNREIAPNAHSDALNNTSGRNTTVTQKRDDKNYTPRSGNSQVNQFSSSSKKNITCNCKKSKCLKLYCECFSAGEFCGQECNCANCSNTIDNPIERFNAMNNRIEKNPVCFQPKVDSDAKHTQGCNCQRTGCLKKYCQCFQAGVPCNQICKCQGCKNCDSNYKRSATRSNLTITNITGKMSLTQYQNENDSNQYNEDDEENSQEYEELENYEYQPTPPSSEKYREKEKDYKRLENNQKIHLANQFNSSYNITDFNMPIGPHMVHNTSGALAISSQPHSAPDQQHEHDGSYYPNQYNSNPYPPHVVNSSGNSYASHQWSQSPGNSPALLQTTGYRDIHPPRYGGFSQQSQLRKIQYGHPITRYTRYNNTNTEAENYENCEDYDEHKDYQNEEPKIRAIAFNK